MWDAIFVSNEMFLKPEVAVVIVIVVVF